MVALRVALVIAWIVAQVVGVIVAVLSSRDGAYAAGVALPLDAALVGLPAAFGMGGLWLSARAAGRGGVRAEAAALIVPLLLLVLGTVVVLRTMA